jgi:hypothetical protein
LSTSCVGGATLAGALEVIGALRLAGASLLGCAVTLFCGAGAVAGSLRGFFLETSCVGGGEMRRRLASGLSASAGASSALPSSIGRRNFELWIEDLCNNLRLADGTWWFLVEDVTIVASGLL